MRLSRYGRMGMICAHAKESQLPPPEVKRSPYFGASETARLTGLRRGNCNRADCPLSDIALRKQSAQTWQNPRDFCARKKRLLLEVALKRQGGRETLWKAMYGVVPLGTSRVKCTTLEESQSHSYTASFIANTCGTFVSISLRYSSISNYYL